MNFEGMMMTKIVVMMIMMPNALHYTENVQRHANLCVFTDWCFYTVFVRKNGCKDRNLFLQITQPVEVALVQELEGGTLWLELSSLLLPKCGP